MALIRWHFRIYFCRKVCASPKLGFNKIYAAQCRDCLFPHNRECPTELREAVASIIFAAPRCSDVPDLLQIKNLFAAKYGKEFILAASELRPDTSVNRAVNCSSISRIFCLLICLQEWHSNLIHFDYFCFFTDNRKAFSKHSNWRSKAKAIEGNRSGVQSGMGFF